MTVPTANFSPASKEKGQDDPARYVRAGPFFTPPHTRRAAALWRAPCGGRHDDLAAGGVVAEQLAAVAAGGQQLRALRAADGHDVRELALAGGHRRAQGDELGAGAMDGVDVDAHVYLPAGCAHGGAHRVHIALAVVVGGDGPARGAYQLQIFFVQLSHK